MIKKRPENYNSQLIGDLLKEISPKEQKRTERKMLLAARIQDALDSNGMKKKDLAKNLKKQPSEITKWLSGTHNFTTETLWDLEDVLEIRLVDLGNEKHEQVVFMASITVEHRIDEPVCFPYQIDFSDSQRNYKPVSSIRFTA